MRDKKATISVILKKAVRKNGTSPLMIRISHKGKRIYKTIANVKPMDWNSKKTMVKNSNKNHGQINKSIELAMVNFRSYTKNPLKFFDAPINKTLCELLLGISDKLDSQERFREGQKLRTLRNKILDFKDCSVRDVNHQYLIDFDAHMRIKYNNAPSTRERYMKSLRAIFKKEFAEGNIDSFPFLNYRSEKSKTYREKLTANEIVLLEKYEPCSFSEEVAKNAFLLSYYLWGLRVYDLLTLRRFNYRGGYISLNESKTGKLKKVFVSEKIKLILDIYQYHGEYLLPIVKMKFDNTYTFKRHVDSRNSYIRKILKQIMPKIGIEKNISMHCARHSFAYNCLKKGVDIKSIQNLLNHSSLDETERYVSTLVDNDKLNDLVLGLGL